MQVGDKKKAGVLSVVAVGAIGFVILQLVPKAEAKPMPRADTGTASTSVAIDPVAPVAAAPQAAVSLERDPFALAPRAKPRPSTAPRSADDENLDQGSTPTVLPPIDNSSPAPFLLPQALPKSVESSAPAPKSVRPQPRPPIVETPPPVLVKTIVRLLGVVEAPTPVAMLLIGERERTARVGDEIAPGVRIEAISLAGITFRNTPGVRLAPGEETSL